MKNGAIPTLPNLIIIGAMKAGTTSLHHYLSKHPQIFMSVKKEVNFFDRDVIGRDIDWYKSNFDANYPVNGEASPQYTRFPRNPGVPERIRQTTPNAKLIYMVRDPVDRIVAHYVEIVTGWREPRPFSEILATLTRQEAQYVECSSYFLQLSQYLKYFSRDDIHIVILERMAKNTREELRKIFRFVGVDDDFWLPEFNQRLNVAENKRPPAPWFTAVTPAWLRRECVDPTWVPWKIVQALHGLGRIGAVSVPKPVLTPDEDLRLERLLKRDVEAMRDYLGDPLSDWRPYAG